MFIFLHDCNQKIGKQLYSYLCVKSLYSPKALQVYP